MDILVVGGGGREHAIIKKLKESPKAGRLYAAPGNGGIACDAECVNIAATDIDRMIDFAKQKNIDLVFVAPDDPLAEGMVDAFERENIMTFGPNAKAAEIESSKVFSKGLMKKYHIPTADYEVFDNQEDAVNYIRELKTYPTVIKADGLALGKGVYICESAQEAIKAINSLMKDKVFGNSGNKIVVEEYLTGPEVSVLAFTDGKTVKPMVSSKDHKRAFDGNKGLNTGGMGTISPNPYYTNAIAEQCMNEIFLPTIKAMNEEGRKFKGCLYFGLMLTKRGPVVIEYNSRFGDPETQVVLPRLKTDFIDIITAVYNETLSELDIQWTDRCAACVILASGGYPQKYAKGFEISGLDSNGQAPGVTVYHSGTKLENGKFLTNGGRVLGVTALGDSLDEALKKAYDSIKGISFKNMQYRTDIGK
jgi:phosphoribosylamine--glycine ligase